MAALAPHTGRATVIGLTGSPGVGKSTSTAALVTGAPRGRASGSACSRSTRPRRSPAGRCSATGCGCRTTPPTRASSSGRWPAAATSAGWPWPTPQALRVLDAAGCDVVLVETVGVGQSEVEVARLADTTSCCWRPGWATAIQAAKAGILEIGDVLVVNKADRDGADADRPRPPAHARARRAARPGRLAAADRADRRRPRARASTTSSPRWTSTAPGWRSTGAAAAAPARPGGRRDRGDRAHRAARAHRRPARGPRRLDALAAQVVAGALDPYAAADQLVDTLTAWVPRPRPCRRRTPRPAPECPVPERGRRSTRWGWTVRERGGVIGDPLAKRSRRRSEDVEHRRGDERRPSHRCAPRGEQHVHDRARPASLRLASKLVRRQLLERDPTPQDVTDDATCSA